jgi:hypothetical protein
MVIKTDKEAECVGKINVNGAKIIENGNVVWVR